MCPCQNPRFKELLVKTVLDGIEGSLNIKLDRDGIIYLRMDYKGLPTATVIRQKVCRYLNLQHHSVTNLTV